MYVCISGLDNGTNCDGSSLPCVNGSCSRFVSFCYGTLKEPNRLFVRSVEAGGEQRSYDLGMWDVYGGDRRTPGKETETEASIT